MRLEYYMEQVTKECNNLKMIYFPYNKTYRVVDADMNTVIGLNGNCNYSGWNNDYLYNNITEFYNASKCREENIKVKDLYVQTLFPEPTEFAKFYKKVCKEINNET